MKSFTDDFSAVKTGEIATGVFVALVAFKLAKALLRACFE